MHSVSRLYMVLIYQLQAPTAFTVGGVSPSGNSHECSPESVRMRCPCQSSRHITVYRNGYLIHDTGTEIGSSVF
jgi:hypothetical protein